MEKCPFCGHQLISCECSNDVTNDELMEILKTTERVPYVDIPVLCSLCGKGRSRYIYDKKLEMEKIYNSRVTW